MREKVEPRGDPHHPIFGREWRCEPAGVDTPEEGELHGAVAIDEYGDGVLGRLEDDQLPEGRELREASVRVKGS